MITICGPSQSGKSFWIKKLFEHIEVMITPETKKIVYLYTHFQDKLYNEMRDEIAKKPGYTLEFVNCSKGIPHVSDIQTNNNDDTLIVLDDLMIVAASSKLNQERIDALAVQDVHHRNVSVIYVCQNLAYGNGKLRNLRINSQYYLMFKNLSDCKNIEMVGRNRGIKSARLDNVLRDVESNPFGYLLFDNCVKSYSNTRVRTGIFPGEETIIYDL